MDGNRKPAPRAGGAILAGAILAGVIGGIIAGEPSIGFLMGTSLGILATVLLWLKDRKN